MALALFGVLVTGASGCDSRQEFYATAYYCVYNSEMDGHQTVDWLIEDKYYELKASFLFGKEGVVTEGVGRTRPHGDYILYDGGGGNLVDLDDKVVKERYAQLGITDFTGFGGSGLEYPAQAVYYEVHTVIGSNTNQLSAWYSIAADPLVLPFGTTGTLYFQNGTTSDGATEMAFSVDDIGHAIKGNRIDIYVGEGKAALEEWEKTGDNRYVYLKLATD